MEACRRDLQRYAIERDEFAEALGHRDRFDSRARVGVVTADRLDISILCSRVADRRYLVMLSSAGAPIRVRLGEQVMIMISRVRM